MELLGKGFRGEALYGLPVIGGMPSEGIMEAVPLVPACVMIFLLSRVPTFVTGLESDSVNDHGLHEPSTFKSQNKPFFYKVDNLGHSVVRES